MTHRTITHRTITIVATVIATGERYECFTWAGDAASGIARAKADVRGSKLATQLKDYRAE